jgi:hypothetical protein
LFSSAGEPGSVILMVAARHLPVRVSSDLPVEGMGADVSWPCIAFSAGGNAWRRCAFSAVFVTVLALLPFVSTMARWWYGGLAAAKKTGRHYICLWRALLKEGGAYYCVSLPFGKRFGRGERSAFNSGANRRWPVWISAWYSQCSDEPCVAAIIFCQRSLSAAIAAELLFLSCTYLNSLC